MTKWGGFPLGAGRHHIADFHLSIIDDDPINEPFDQVSVLGKGQCVKSWLDTLANPLDSLGQRRSIHVLLRLDIELPQLLREATLGLGHLLLVYARTPRAQ